MKDYKNVDQIKDEYANNVVSRQFAAPPYFIRLHIIEAIDATVSFLTGDKDEQRKVVNDFSNEDFKNINHAVQRFNAVAFSLKSTEALGALVNLALSTGYSLGVGDPTEERPALEWKTVGNFLYNLSEDGSARYMITPVGTGPTVMLIYLDEVKGSTLGEFGSIEAAKSSACSHYYG